MMMCNFMNYLTFTIAREKPEWTSISGAGVLLAFRNDEQAASLTDDKVAFPRKAGVHYSQ
jgi:hypothetical protein